VAWNSNSSNYKNITRSGYERIEYLFVQRYTWYGLLQYVYCKAEKRQLFSRDKETKYPKQKNPKPSERIYTFALLLSFLEGNAYSLLATVAKNNLFLSLSTKNNLYDTNRDLTLYFFCLPSMLTFLDDSTKIKTTKLKDRSINMHVS